MSGHTPGPWRAVFNDQGGFEVSAVDGPYAVLCNRASWPHRVDESIANGRLISVAPELLETLQYFADVYCEGWCKENSGEFNDCGGCKARAVIAKATGGEP